MNILWFPRLQYDVDRLHWVTWLEMAKALEAQGHHVRVAVAGMPKNAAPRGWIRLPLVPVKGLRLAGFWLFGYFAFLWQFLAIRPDLVLLDVHTAGFALPLAWIFRGTVWVLDQRTPIAHTSLQRGFLRSRLEQCLTSTAMAIARRWCDGLTAITADFRARVSARYGIALERIGVWGSGVDLELFDPTRVRSDARPEDFAGRFVLFQHGELSVNRGILETVRALREPGLESVELVLLGAGPAQGEILRLARECQVAERVRILPPVPHADVPAQIAGSDCAVLAYPVDEYWNCNHPIKFAEYLAMGKVVICTPLAVVREAGADARFLEVISDNRPETIAAGLRNCLADSDLCGRGLGGRAYVQEQGTWAAQAVRLLAFVDELRRKRGRA